MSYQPFSGLRKTPDDPEASTSVSRSASPVPSTEHARDRGDARPMHEAASRRREDRRLGGGEVEQVAEVVGADPELPRDHPRAPAVLADDVVRAHGALQRESAQRGLVGKRILDAVPHAHAPGRTGSDRLGAKRARPESRIVRRHLVRFVGAAGEQAGDASRRRWLFEIDRRLDLFLEGHRPTRWLHGGRLVGRLDVGKVGRIGWFEGGERIRERHERSLVVGPDLATAPTGDGPGRAPDFRLVGHWVRSRPKRAR